MSSLSLKLLPFLAWRHRVTRETLRMDLLAGVVSALLVLPQAVAFSTLAGLPPQYGLYAAMLPAIVGALWGSSWHLVSGPTNATSLMVYASLSAMAIPFSDDYVRLALTLNLMLGVTKLALGAFRLGGFTNFISQTVVVGFTAGAGFLIIAAQLKNLLGLKLPSTPSFPHALQTVASHLGEADPWAVVVGTATLLAAIASRRLGPRVPHLLVGLLVGSVLGWWLNRTGVAHIATVGALPSALPTPSVPDFEPATWRALAPACLALTLIGLTEALSSARAVTLRSGQRLDANQEVIGQGLANVVGAFSSSYPSSGSFNRTGANYDAGARTPLAAVFSAFILVGVLFLVGPLAGFMPIAAMAGLLFLVAIGLIDVTAIRRIALTSRGEAVVLAVTFVATLTVQLEFAIFVGVLASLLAYLARTTRPRVTPLRLDPTRPGRHLVHAVPGTSTGCPEILFLRLDGSLFFGAVDHVGEELNGYRRREPAPKHIVLAGTGMNFIDFAGAEFLLQEARIARESGASLYLCSLKPPVREVLERGGFLEAFGPQNVFDTEKEALDRLFALLGPERAAACGEEASV